ncbi:MAG: sigma-54-dependent transcriptional regulator [Acidobacteriota bacterium]
MASDTARTSVLLVDETPATVEGMRRALHAAGFRVLAAGSFGEAVRLMRAETFDVVLASVRLTGEDDFSLLVYVRTHHQATEVIVTANYATVEAAVTAMRLGAADYLAKPVEAERLLGAVHRALSGRRSGPLGAGDDARPLPSAYGLWGESEPMHRVFKAIAKAASVSATVLISGESGTGKELVARAIHYSSSRSSAPFVAVNCGAIPDTLLESELFGYVKGAFTGASESRAGFFQTADGGTIFLDEISETTPPMQVKLLRVLQDKEICMVGATRPRKVDVRIVASTNRDPLTLVEKGLLREDLFYRLNVIAVALPPLRERGDDALLLVRHFARKYADDYGKPLPEFSDAAMRALAAFPWPGNVREMENVVQRLVVMSEGGTIGVADLPAALQHPVPRGTGLDRPLAEVERDYIQNVLTSVGGNRSRAARILRIDRKTLRGKLAGA